jgi:hypothetical protein
VWVPRSSMMLCSAGCSALSVCQDPPSSPGAFIFAGGRERERKRRDEMRLSLNGQSIVKLASFTGGHAVFSIQACPELAGMFHSWHACIRPPIPMVKTYSNLHH